MGLTDLVGRISPHTVGDGPIDNHNRNSLKGRSPMFSKILIANRGEIAVRIIDTCARLNVSTVAVHSSADAASLHVRRADEAIDLGDGPASENYLNPQAIVDAALNSGAEAIHPGYGFLSENAGFAQAVADAGLVFIGPSPAAISTMGDKVASREVAIRAKVPMAPGSDGAVDSAEAVLEFGEKHGYPILVKASAGGGGRGMRRINGPEEAGESFDAAVREATAAFGNGEVFVERYLVSARHVEVQVVADSHGLVSALGDRDCSVQRRHQKLIEESPAPGLSEKMREDMGAAAARLAGEVGYQGLGTVEFLVEGENFYFLEMNTRIQVEHPVTELVNNVDLVAEQLRIASGEHLGSNITDPQPVGTAIEARINAEDVAGGLFVPSPGVITALSAPTSESVRFDTGYDSGDEVLPFYDSLIGKLIVWGEDRKTAINGLLAALDELQIEGIATTVPAARQIIDTDDFRSVAHTTLWLENSFEFSTDEDEGLARNEVEVNGRFYVIPQFSDDPALSVGRPAAEAPAEGESADRRRKSNGARKRRSGPTFDGTVKAPMQGTIIKVNVEPGAAVTTGEPLFVLEAMKMENPVASPITGTVDDVLVTLGQSLSAGTHLATMSEGGAA
ncbi:acetyl/propionyl/methylcrotonyl-CoA carboxylase subunit alpha [Brevibacterium epidermidis]|uniref:acetyl/propionyl/methylcrotonyl-CoA carboxylase subunit alpha n=1 Tax=Brevibacterium epidermidis TaxID=1698 RepID=UPI000A49B98B|nr:biotin carboxylase N-terminal domain-containing protein [Brevibacterium epidermidis]